MVALRLDIAHVVVLYNTRHVCDIEVMDEERDMSTVMLRYVKEIN